MIVGDKVQFDQADKDHTQLTGFVTRVWNNKLYVTIKTAEDHPRTFVRLVKEVLPADFDDDDDEPRHPDAYPYGEPWGPDNPAPGSPWHRKEA